MTIWPWRSRSMTPIFNTIFENPKMHIWCQFGDANLNPSQVMVWTSQISNNYEPNGQNDLDDHGQWPPFSTPAENIMGCMFGANLVIPVQICDKLSHRQAKFPRILSQNHLEGQGQWPSFSIPAESFPCLVQTWWFQLKSVTSYHVDKVKFKDGQMARQGMSKLAPAMAAAPHVLFFLNTVESVI